MIGISDREIQQLIRLYEGYWRSFLIELFFVSTEQAWASLFAGFFRNDRIDRRESEIKEQGAIDGPT